MATTRIMPLHIGKGRTESRAISDIIDYVANPQKTDNGKLITGYGCDSRTADAEFLLAKRQYIAATGRVRGADDVIAYHVRQSFKPGEITPEEANRLGVEFAKRFTKGNHAFVVCTHIDKSHIHNHIIWSSVSLEYDRKFRNFWGSTKAVRRLSDTICIENGLSIVENPKLHGKSYNKWLGDQAKPSHRELLRVAIDNALSQSPADFEELLKLLQEYGCEVSKRGKSYRLKLSGWEKAARMDSLGEGYGLEDLRAVLLGKKAHTPRKKTVTQAEPPKVNLLVDIQAKLQAGKGAGYARWAKVFNLKQMAQTMNYLSENNLLEYAVLEEKATAATAHHNELSAQIKAAEKRMAEIAVLRTHIVNYAKTREVYVAYRKAGYSKKFREEHEEEILLHQAAKNAFDEMGVKKLPKVKELQTEYAKLLEEKKKTYSEYRRSREEMRELLTAKANVDRVMKIHASGEDYLEAILVLQKKMGMVRSIDLARHMGFSKPSISHAVGVLKNGGFLTVDDDGFLHLTVIGREIAEKIYERHLFFMEQFIAAGVDQETAEQDACRIEHAISDTSFRKLKEKVQGTD